MNLFADSSALAKRYVADEHSNALDEMLRRSSDLAVSVLCFPEIISGLCRRRRERSLTQAQYESAKQALQADLADITIVQLVDEVVLDSIRFMESNPLRASDAIHISSALAWHADLFVSADRRQCTAARAAGLDVTQLM